MTLNSLFAQRIVETGMVLSRSSLSLANVEFMPAAKVGTAARTESDKLRKVWTREERIKNASTPMFLVEGRKSGGWES